jgi:hypothetical protein
MYLYSWTFRIIRVFANPGWNRPSLTISGISCSSSGRGFSFVARQKLYLPTEEELRRELEREKKLIEENRFEGGGE